MSLENQPEEIKHLERKKEIMLNLIKQSRKLIDEGREKNDYSILALGNMLGLLSGLVTDEEDFREFSNLAKMYSANKMVDSLMLDPMLGPLIMMRGNPDGDEDLMAKIIKRFEEESGEESED